MKSDAQLRKEIEKYCTDRGLVYCVKEDSWLMRLIGKILFFNKGFMTQYMTTIHEKVYFSREDYENDYCVWLVSPHEMTHLDDSRRFTYLLYDAIYLFPQCLAILAPLAFGAFWNLNFLWFLFSLLFLLPIPAPGRKYIEQRGFTMSMAVSQWSREAKDAPKMTEPPEYIIRNLTSSNYYYCWPFRKWVVTDLKKQLEKIDDGTIDAEIPIAKDIREIILGDKDVGESATTDPEA